MIQPGAGQFEMVAALDGFEELGENLDVLHNPLSHVHTKAVLFEKVA